MKTRTLPSPQRHDSVTQQSAVLFNSAKACASALRQHTGFLGPPESLGAYDRFGAYRKPVRLQRMIASGKYQSSTNRSWTGDD